MPLAAIIGGVAGAAGGLGQSVINAQTERKTRNKSLDLIREMNTQNVDDLWAKVQDLTAKVDKKTKKISDLKMALGQTEKAAAAAVDSANSAAEQAWLTPALIVGALVVVWWFFIRKK